MIWVFSIVVVSLVAVLIQMLLVYQKKAYDLRIRQALIRKKIRDHIWNLQEMTKNIRGTASERISELEAAHCIWAERVAPLTKELEELKKLVLPAPEENEEDSIVDPGEGPVSESEEIQIRKLLAEGKAKKIEIDGNLSGIECDTRVVKCTLEQMEEKLKRVPLAGKD